MISSARFLMKDIKEILEAAKAEGCTISNDVRVSNVSLYVAVKDNVDYWSTVTLNTAIPAMVPKQVSGADGTSVVYEKGLSKTVTVPIWLLFLVLNSTLFAIILTP